MRTLLTSIEARINAARSAPVTVTRGDGTTKVVDLKYFGHAPEIVGGARPLTRLGPGNLPHLWIVPGGTTFTRQASDLTEATLRVRLRVFLAIHQRDASTAGTAPTVDAQKGLLAVYQDLFDLLDDHRFAAAYDTAFVVSEGEIELVGAEDQPYLAAGEVVVEYLQFVK